MSMDVSRRIKQLRNEELSKDVETRAREHALVEKLHQEAFERARNEPRPPPPEPPTIHYTELPASRPGAVLFHEWNHYRREAGRLLAEGHEGRFVLIKGEDIIGIWDTEDEAVAVGYEKYLMQPRLIHRILTREPLLRVPPKLWPYIS